MSTFDVMQKARTLADLAEHYDSTGQRRASLEKQLNKIHIKESKALEDLLAAQAAYDEVAGDEGLR